MSYKLQRTEKKLLNMQLLSGQTRKGPDFLQTAWNEIIITKNHVAFIMHFYTIGLKGKIKTFNGNHDYVLYWTTLFIGESCFEKKRGCVSNNSPESYTCSSTSSLIH